LTIFIYDTPFYHRYASPPTLRRHFFSRAAGAARDARCICHAGACRARYARGAARAARDFQRWLKASGDAFGSDAAGAGCLCLISRERGVR